jgi:hypothetical protein
MGYTSYESLNNLGEVSFIAGTEFPFTMNFYTDSSHLNPADLTDYTAELRLALFGQPTTLAVSVNGTLTLPNIFDFVLATADTESLPPGKYIYQPVLLDTLTSQNYILGQGTIILLAQIASA